MTILHVAGVDPGLRNTGVVVIQMDSIQKILKVTATAIDGADVAAVSDAIKYHDHISVFIERYEDRGTVFGTHAEMRAMEHELKLAMPKAKLLSNTGIKKVVTDEMLDEFGLLHLATTNHRDLQAAARIGLLGALRVPAMNSVIYGFLIDQVRGETWQRQ